MRRSLAPSLQGSSTVSRELTEILHSSENHVKELRKLPLAVASTTTENTDQPASEKYSVVFAKKSTKKHKTYDEDGSLEVRNGFFHVKSASGRYIGSDSLAKHRIEEGAEFQIGGFDVLVSEKVAFQPGKLTSGSGKLTPGSGKLTPGLGTPKVARQAFKSPAVLQSAESPSAPKRFLKFNVVWGPITTKKHKTWEGDGTLEISGKVARLRDEKGKVVATDYNLKQSDLEEGSRITLENKELEIVEVVAGATSSEATPPPAKCPRLSLPFRPPTILETPPAPPSPSLKFERVVNYGSVEEPASSWSPTYSPVVSGETPPATVLVEPNASQLEPPKPVSHAEIVLPSPQFDHQMKYNTRSVPVVPVVIPGRLAGLLRPHQQQGVKFLYEAVMGFHVVNQVECQGAILADEMGLGKTIQCVTLMFVLLKQGPYGSPIARNILVVTPSSLVDSWKHEITKWLEHDRIYSFEVSSKNKAHEFARSHHIPIMIVSYEMFVKQHEDISEIRFDLMICDEGHRLKNSTIKASTLLAQNSCKRRILLTGTPIQNDLEEFFSLVNFVNPGVLGSYPEFKAHFETPIVQSQQQSVILEEYRKLGQKRAAELAEITSTFFLRRTQEINRKYLPPKQEVVVFCEPSELQKVTTARILVSYSETSDILPLQLITVLKKICNHPLLLAEGDFKRFLPPSISKISMFDSSKIEVVHSLIVKMYQYHEKVVLVSYFSQTLDMLEELCRESDFVFLRLDGATPAADRSKIVAAFNKPHSDSFVFLLSAKAGGAGLNLVGASRLVLFDNDWNPATDLQAMSRIWRDGQTRPVYIYRLLTCGTIEEKIFQRQVSKTSLGERVIEHQKSQNAMKFSDEELRDLFSLPDDFKTCLTHESLGCSCDGDGEIPEGLNSSFFGAEEDENPFVTSPKGRKSGRTLQMHELMKYEHHGAPFQDDLLQELCLEDVREVISFVFRSRVKSEKKPREDPTPVAAPEVAGDNFWSGISVDESITFDLDEVIM